MAGSILNEVAGEDVSEKKVFEQRPEGREGRSQPSGERVLQVEEGAYPERLRNNEDAGTARAEQGRGERRCVREQSRQEDAGKKHRRPGLARSHQESRKVSSNVIFTVTMRELRPEATHLGVKADLTLRTGSLPWAPGKKGQCRCMLPSPKRFPRWPQNWDTKVPRSLSTLLASWGKKPP